MLGNLVENAAKYGGGSVFVTVAAQAGFVEILVEDDGTGIPENERVRIFDRGVRLDTGSRARARASPSSATWRRFMAVPFRSRRARIWAGCSCGSGCRRRWAEPPIAKHPRPSAHASGWEGRGW